MRLAVSVAPAKWVRIFVAVAAADDGGEGVGGGLLDAADAAEVLEEALAGAGAYAGDVVELGSRGRASGGACGGR